MVKFWVISRGRSKSGQGEATSTSVRDARAPVKADQCCAAVEAAGMDVVCLVVDIDRFDLEHCEIGTERAASNERESERKW